MSRRAIGLLPIWLLAALLGSAAFAVGAGASPVWKFEHKELSGSESIAGSAGESSLIASGVETTCKEVTYGITISNEGGIAKGKFNEVPFKNCFTNVSECAIESVTAEKLPWATHGTVVVSTSYLLLEGIKIVVRYVPNENCVLDGVVLPYTGSAGGKYDNSKGTFTFDPSGFKATGTEIKVLGTPVEWSDVFTTEALGPHKGQTLELG